MNISTTIDDRQVRNALNRAMRALENPTSLMRTLANQQYASTVKNFQQESFDGQPWPALQPETAQAFITGRKTRGLVERAGGKGAAITLLTPNTGRRRKRVGKRRGYDNMLRPTGKLIFQRLHQQHTRTQAIIACANPWAFVHNFGVAGMPRRTFLGFSAADRRAIREAAEWWIKRSVLP